MNSLFDDPLFGQRLLKSAGLYTGLLDGDIGNMSKAALKAFNDLGASYRAKYGKFDDRTEANIATLLPKAQVAARKFMVLANSKFPLTVKILSGTRSYAEQNALFAKRPKVTNARGGQSNHNFGIAWDVGVFEGGKYYTGANSKENKAYSDLAKLMKPELSYAQAKLPENKLLDWGGDWKSIVDMPHYELHTGKSVSSIRALLEQGKPYV